MNTRALFVASSGGHLNELVQLRPSLVDSQTEITWVTVESTHSRSLLAGEPRVIFVNNVGPRAYFALLRAVLPALRILLRVRPSAVYSTGSAIAMAFLPLAFLVHARAAYIESAAGVDGPSHTGRLLRLLPWIRLRPQYASRAERRSQHDGSVFDGRRARPASSLRRRVLVSSAAVIAMVGSGAVIESAGAVGLAAAQSTAVSAVPSKATPNVTNGTVFAITQVGGLTLLGGTFTTVQDPGSSTTLTRTYVLAFDAATGKVSTTFAPTLDGSVQAVAPGPIANTVYVGGYFNTVNSVKSKGLTLLDTRTGAIVSGFKPPALNGAVSTVAVAAGHTLVGGGFTAAGSAARAGLMSLNPTTGALDGYLTVALSGHHNYNGTTGANGAVGARALSVNPAGTRAVVIGNFKTANGALRDQAVMLDLGGAAATVDSWATGQYTAPCASNAFDTYVRDVQYSPDGSYFVVVATGGATTSLNTDGSRSLCDTAARWDASSTSGNAMPSWVDYTGNDTLWSVALTGTAVYVGGHQRWLNNLNGYDSAAAGAVPRPGIAALDPASGVPLTWNPGRNPRGAGAYALFVNASGLYVGSDTDYIGNYAYLRRKIAYFPLAGGAAPASTATASLPANVYVAGAGRPDAPFTSADLYYRAYDGTRVGASTGVANTGVNWADTRGAFMVGSTIFYGTSAGTFNRAAFNGSTVSTPVALDPYNDPKWSTVDTGSGQTYRGATSDYYSEIPNVAGAFYSGGRLYYTLKGQPGLYWRWFSPDSGIVGGAQPSSTAFDFSQVAGMFASGSSIYWASAADGTLHRVSFAAGVADPATATVVGGPAVDGKDWRAQGLFAYGAPTFPNAVPTASATASCAQLTCSFDGSASTDSDGTIASYAWSFGDGTTGTGVKPAHAYATAGSYSVSLRVTDNRGGVSPAWTGQVTATAASASVGFVGTSGANALTAAPSVQIPSNVQAGNTELLLVTSGTNGVTTSPPSGGGWQQVAQRTDSPIETTVFQRTAGAADAGSTVTVPLAASTRVDLRMVVYSGVSSASVTTATDSNTAAHVTPAATTSVGGSWLLSFWSSRTSSTSSWTTPSSVTVRGTGVGAGGGHVDSVIGDSGPLASGTYGSLTANSGVVGGKGAMVSVVLVPTA